MPCAPSAGATSTSCQQAHQAPASADAGDSNASAMAMLVVAIAVLAMMFVGTMAILARNRRMRARRLAEDLAREREAFEVKAREAERAFETWRHAFGVTNPDGTVMVAMNDRDEDGGGGGSGGGDAVVVVDVENNESAYSFAAFVVELRDAGPPSTVDRGPEAV